MSLAARLSRVMVPDAARTSVHALRVRWRLASVRQALREQGLQPLVERLAAAVPDIGDQYTSYRLDSEYLSTTTRALHAFQMSLVNEALSRVVRPGAEPITVVDIGDSAGTHIRYLRALHPDLPLRCLSVNLDEDAVQRIRAHGLEAVCIRAEDLAAQGIDAQLLLLFETLEHLSDPIRFLKQLSEGCACDALVLTTPYVAQSRVGLHHIRRGCQERVTPETTHLFELSPGDWRLCFAHAGWTVAFERTYLQYPRARLLRVLRDEWRASDFEGFWGAILTRDSRWKDLYTGW